MFLIVPWSVGYIRFKDGFQEIFPVEDYLDLFDLAAHNIQKGISGNSSGEHRALQLVTGTTRMCGWVNVAFTVHCASECFASFHVVFSENLWTKQLDPDPDSNYRSLLSTFSFIVSTFSLSLDFPQADFRNFCAGGKYCSSSSVV